MADFLDVSEHNGSVDWKKVAGRVKGVYVRIADGDYRDKFYGDQRIKEIRAAKLTWGPYYFARVASPQNGERSGSQEAAMAIGFAKETGWPRANDLPLAYDFEDLNGQSTAKAARHLVQFVRAYHQKLDHLPLIYTMPALWLGVERELSAKDRALVSRCLLWIAHWRVAQPTVPEPWKSWSLWQDSDRWSCAGVKGAVDHSRIEVAISKLTVGKQIAGVKPVAKPSAKPEPEVETTKKRPTGVPKWLTEEFWGNWQKPWTEKARKSQRFRNLLWEHGYASPSFGRDETRSHDPARTPVPDSLRGNAQRHAFNLEIVRHKLGDKPIAILSWYRTPTWNRTVGGASQSRHMQADATDFDVALVDSFGRSRFDAVGESVFAKGGFGTYPGGSRHMDSRGYKARWSSF